ncbi:MAG: PhnD/SsuA/transferrin family substrate-binding protein, partial [Alcanivorax sp.]|uniref:PhnD/SsuA/transferrin family substrate-binding protein n=1 Tax=Alcanivorax sp. TaxID=1872427 RepID=UPI003DA71104
MRFKLLAALFAALLLSACNEPHTGTFVFTAIPDQDESQLEKRFGVVALYLEEQLGVPVKYVPVKSYAAAVTAFRNNEVQMAWFGGLSVVQARRLVPDSQALAQSLEDPDFQSYFIPITITGMSPSDPLQDAYLPQ